MIFPFNHYKIPLNPIKPSFSYGFPIKPSIFPLDNHDISILSRFCHGLDGWLPQKQLKQLQPQPELPAPKTHRVLEEGMMLCLKGTCVCGCISQLIPKNSIHIFFIRYLLCVHIYTHMYIYIYTYVRVWTRIMYIVYIHSIYQYIHNACMYIIILTIYIYIYTYT